MTKPCSVCSHPKRDSIEKCLVNGDSFRDIEKIFGVSKSALQRHKAEHLSLYSPAVAENPAVIAKSDDLLGQLKDLITRTLAALDRAESAGDDRMFLLAVREARSNAELMMKAQAYLAAQSAKESPEGGHKVLFIYPKLQERREAVLARLGEIIEARVAAGQANNLQAMTMEERGEFLEKLIGPVKQMVEPSIMIPDNGRDGYADEYRKRVDRTARYIKEKMDKGAPINLDEMSAAEKEAYIAVVLQARKFGPCLEQKAVDNTNSATLEGEKSNGQ